MARQYVIAGNWKMYKTGKEAQAFIEQLAPLVKDSTSSVYLSVPYTAIQSAAEKAAGTNVIIGAQNMNDASEGAFTGEISAEMLKDAGAQFVILGHSERRLYFNETNEFINKKIKKALSDDIQPILCIGESLEQRESGQANDVLQEQIRESLKSINAEDFSKVILAYEPVWAIGTGKTATPEIAQETHAFCRKVIADIWGDDVAENIVIQYGGSVKPGNVDVLMAQEDIDGALVGGAALEPESFAQIVNFNKK